MNDYETIQKRRNITVGIFVLVAICALMWLIFKFGDLPTAVSRLKSFQVFVQFLSAPGVQTDTPVRFCGYQIGRVTKIMAPEIRKDLRTGQAYHQTIAVLSIDRKYVNIPSNVEVKLMTRGLGSSYVELTVDPARLPAPPLDPNRPETVFLVDNMVLQGSTGVTSEFFPAESQKKLDSLIDGLNGLIANANDIIGVAENKENVRKSLASFASAAEEAAGTLKEIKAFSSAGAETAVAMTKSSEELSKSLAQLRLILEKIEAGEGTAGRLVNDGKLYENLLENTFQMELVLEELRAFIAQSRKSGLPIKMK